MQTHIWFVFIFRYAWLDNYITRSHVMWNTTSLKLEVLPFSAFVYSVENKIKEKIIYAYISFIRKNLRKRQEFKPIFPTCTWNWSFLYNFMERPHDMGIGGKWTRLNLLILYNFIIVICSVTSSNCLTFTKLQNM